MTPRAAETAISAMLRDIQEWGGTSEPQTTIRALEELAAIATDTNVIENATSEIKNLRRQDRRRRAIARLEAWYNRHPRPVETLLEIYKQNHGAPRCRVEREIWAQLPKEVVKGAEFERLVTVEMDLIKGKRRAQSLRRQAQTAAARYTAGVATLSMSTWRSLPGSLGLSGHDQKLIHETALARLGLDDEHPPAN